MPSKNENDETILKNVNFEELENKKKKSKKFEEILEDEEDIKFKIVDNDDDDEDVEENDDEDNDDEDDDEDDDDDDDEFGDGLTDVGLYNVLGNFFVDEEGNTIATSLANIAKELSKLNHIVKKYTSKN
jgi:hypothetical protein